MPRPPDPITIPWLGGSIRVRHDDPRLKPYSPKASVILAASTLASTPDGLQHVLDATVGEWYLVRVSAGDTVRVGLRRRQAGNRQRQ